MTLTLDQAQALPKIELHAHLSGSISQAKLIELLQERGSADKFTPFDLHGDLTDSLAKCFDYFDRVAKVVTDLESLHQCTLHVLDSFASENCLYLELRTSPKQFKTASGSCSSKLDYLRTVHSAVKEFQASAEAHHGFTMEVKLLLSLDRGKVKCKEDALAQLDDIMMLCRESDGFVVGVDVCGNPAAPSVVPFVLPAMLERGDFLATMPVTFHTSETPSVEEDTAILDNVAALNIRRLGHVCFLTEGCREQLLKGGLHADGGKMGIELCPTSNRVTRELTSLDDHHFPSWWKQSDQVLLSINTDDTGLFSCSLSGEVFDLATAFSLSVKDILDIQLQAIESSFHPDKSQLRKSFDAFLLARGLKEAAE